ncbi:MAG: sigma-70 family RNA polymerase sigma factor [Clostridia bacterium]|nr:sigma-70 family RNA polymerase sigma factor [Clostridia bacterium]
MDDKRIVEMLFLRDEKALEEAQKQYGRLCHYVANNILNSPLDAQECVNDTLLRAWNSIPPNKPQKLGAYLVKIARNVAIDKYNQSKAIKRRGSENALVFEELEELITKDESIVDELTLKECINTFLRSLSKARRIIFVQRYFYHSSIKEIAKNNSLSESNVKVILSRLRDSFKNHLKKFGMEV